MLKVLEVVVCAALALAGYLVLYMLRLFVLDYRASRRRKW